ncbi:elongation of very long chain fatty acids protein, partial [Salmonella sp. s51228]|uniref:elongation of very long chain fatty acids protein n=1 Tax=Salmonella sp. s51228 TaxID=3159652 RepID=UPI00397FFFB5
MFTIWWMGIAWVAGGQSTLGAILNSIVHIVMYTYYGLSSFPELRPFLWWKKHITHLQLIQFGSGVVLGAYTILTGCNFPMWMQLTFVAYATSFLILFGNFYYQAYVKSNKSKKAKRVQHDTP